MKEERKERKEGGRKGGKGGRYGSSSSQCLQTVKDEITASLWDIFLKCFKQRNIYDLSHCQLSCSLKPKNSTWYILQVPVHKMRHWLRNTLTATDWLKHSKISFSLYPSQELEIQVSVSVSYKRWFRYIHLPVNIFNYLQHPVITETVFYKKISKIL